MTQETDLASLYRELMDDPDLTVASACDMMPNSKEIIMRKFIGSWCKKMDEMGDHQYGSLVAPTKDLAHQRAIAKGKALGECEWVGVREEVWVGDKLHGYWETVGRWTGDWDGTLE
jgi:hypothetical protein